MTIISILPYTDGFFGSIFLYFRTICQNAPPQSCQKVAKKWILINESGQKKSNKVLKWPDLVEPSA